MKYLVLPTYWLFDDSAVIPETDSLIVEMKELDGYAEGRHLVTLPDGSTMDIDDVDLRQINDGEL